VLVSAGEASGDIYGAGIVDALRARVPGIRFFGCAGPRMQKAGVEPVVDSSSLAVVGLVEVLTHIPRIYGEFRKIQRVAKERRPDLAILTDSPDFHLPLAGKLRRLGVPVIYLVAPQVWAWRRGRLKTLRRNVNQLLCIFPFEEKFFRDNGVPATYLGHPLAWSIRPSVSREEFFHRNGLPAGLPVVVLLPGSRRGEIDRHLPALMDSVRRLGEKRAFTFVLATNPVPGRRAELQAVLKSLPVRVVEGQTWDVLAHSDLALAASGTVTVEAALLGIPMVTFYRVTGLSWLMGRFLLDVPFYSMVNLVAGRKIVPELMQDEMTGERLAAEAETLLEDAGARERMKQDLAGVARALATETDPMQRAADAVAEFLEKE
jgi:lipid-A-disaccharide synthase